LAFKAAAYDVGTVGDETLNAMLVAGYLSWHTLENLFSLLIRRFGFMPARTPLGVVPGTYAAVEDHHCVAQHEDANAAEKDGEEYFHGALRNQRHTATHYHWGIAAYVVVVKVEGIERSGQGLPLEILLQLLLRVA